jgi:Secretion system C-terminal sorting domain
MHCPTNFTKNINQNKMKKIYSTFLVAFSTIMFSMAQPILTATNYTNFSVNVRMVDVFSGITVSPAGPNQTWNYATLIASPTILGTATTVPAVTAPFYSSFPTANFCIKISTSFNGVDYINYNLAKLNSSGLENLGSTSSGGITEQFIDTQFSPLPLTYSTTYTDVYQSTTDDTPSSNIDTYDAYGTLTTPYGTFTNVIRVKSVGENFTGYSWFKANPYTPLLDIDVENATGSVSSVSLYQSTNLDTNQVFSDRSILLYPNPTSDFITIDTKENYSEIKITDLLGKTVFETKQNDSKIDLSFLETGFYIINFKTEEGEKTMKISKK